MYMHSYTVQDGSGLFTRITETKLLVYRIVVYGTLIGATGV